jgi:hypothetical protein
MRQKFYSSDINKKNSCFIKNNQKKAYSEVVPSDDRMSIAYFDLKH